MSMGYDDDDPRREAFEAKLSTGVWRLVPGQRPNNSAADKRRTASEAARRRLASMNPVQRARLNAEWEA